MYELHVRACYKQVEKGSQDTATHRKWRASADDSKYCSGRVNSGIMTSGFKEDRCADIGCTWSSSRQVQVEPSHNRAIPPAQYSYKTQPQASSEENWDDEIANSITPSLSTLSNSANINLSQYSQESFQSVNSYGNLTDGNGFKSGYHSGYKGFQNGSNRCQRGSFDYQRQSDSSSFMQDNYEHNDTWMKKEVCSRAQKMDIPSETKGRVIGKFGQFS